MWQPDVRATSMPDRPRSETDGFFVILGIAAPSRRQIPAPNERQADALWRCRRRIGAAAPLKPHAVALAASRSNARAITRRWIWFVPS